VEGKRFFEYELLQDDSEPAAPKREIVTFEVTIKPQSFEGKNCHLVVVRSVSHVLKHEKL